MVFKTFIREDIVDYVQVNGIFTGNLSIFLLFSARGKSPKGSRSSSQERVQATGDNMFIRANSLKAWKDEQARLKAEEEEKEREKSAKRSKSAQKKVHVVVKYTLTNYVIKYNVFKMKYSFEILHF